MADREHHYRVETTWTGNRGEGTASYAAYDRDHLLSAPGKPDILGSADANFRGDRTRWNPEELLVASLSACHQLWYLHLCSAHGLVVTDYRDAAEGWMREGPNGGGQFTRVLLRPRVALATGADIELAQSLHRQANAMCFIARSVAFPVEHQAETVHAPPVPSAPAAG